MGPRRREADRFSHRGCSCISENIAFQWFEGGKDEVRMMKMHSRSIPLPFLPNWFGYFDGVCSQFPAKTRELPAKKISRQTGIDVDLPLASRRPSPPVPRRISRANCRQVEEVLPWSPRVCAKFGEKSQEWAGDAINLTCCCFLVRSLAWSQGVLQASEER